MFNLIILRIRIITLSAVLLLLFLFYILGYYIYSIINLRLPEAIETFQTIAVEPASRIALSPNLQWIAATFRDEKTEVFRIASPKTHIMLPKCYQSVAWSQSGRLLFAGYVGGIDTLDTTSWKVLSTELKAGHVFDISVNDAGCVFSASSSSSDLIFPGGVHIYQYDDITGNLKEGQLAYRGNAFSISASNSLFAFGANDGTVHMWRCCTKSNEWDEVASFVVQKELRRATAVSLDPTTSRLALFGEFGFRLYKVSDADRFLFEDESIVPSSSDAAAASRDIIAFDIDGMTCTIISVKEARIYSTNSGEVLLRFPGVFGATAMLDDCYVFLSHRGGISKYSLSDRRVRQDAPE